MSAEEQRAVSVARDYFRQQDISCSDCSLAVQEKDGRWVVTLERGSGATEWTDVLTLSKATYQIEGHYGVGF